MVHNLIRKAGRSWSPDGFRSSWRKACATAGVFGATFQVRCGFAAMPALIQVGRIIQSSRNSGLDDALNYSADRMAKLIRKFLQA